MKRLMLTTATLLAAGCNCAQPQHTAQNTPAQNSPSHDYSTQTYQQAERQPDFVGARGPDGPAGAMGAQGPTGQIGVASSAVTGPRGPDGPAGAPGAQGRTGAQGVAGDLAAGPAGEAGPAGKTGIPGTMGQTGIQGALADANSGPAGPVGPAGRTGPQGPTGDIGAKGETLVGPAGPTGNAGAAGAQGERGQTGAQGSTTAVTAGAPGAAGATGPQGPAGATGPQGPAGVVQHWVSYRDFWFDADQSAVHNGDADKVAKIAAYMKANPSLQLGIDGTTSSRTNDQVGQALRDSRVKAVRDSLIAAGVSGNRISNGTFGNADLRRDGRVEVLIKTDQTSLARFDPAGPTGVVNRWTNYQDFWFDANNADIHAADANKVTEMAAYLKANPSLQVGIDSSMNSAVTDQPVIDLARRRGNAVRDALIAAGVPANSIKSGSFGNADLRRDGRVEVLVKTEQVAQSK